MSLTQQRITNFDYLRFLCALIIAMHHYQQVFQVTYDTGINWYGGVLQFGFIVETFYVLSGYLASKWDITNKAYITSVFYRWLRIFPYAFIATFSCCLIYWVYQYLFNTELLFNTSYSVNVQLMSLLLLHQGWFCDLLGINNPTWYLCVLIWINILYFAILKLISIFCKSTQEKWICIISIIFIIIGALGFRSFSKYEIPFLYGSDCRGYASFFVGVLIGKLNKLIDCKKIKVILSIFALLVACIIITVLGKRLQWYVWTFLLSPAVILLLANINQYKGNYSEILGNASFDIYLWHVPFYYLTQLICEWNGIVLVHSRVTMFIMMVVVVLWGLMVYCKVEKPLSVYLNEKTRYDSGGRAGKPVAVTRD